MEPNASLSFHFMNWLNEIEKERLKGERVGWFAFFFVVGYGLLRQPMLRNKEDEQIKPTN